MSAPFIFDEFNVTQYMFCHPENVSPRRGDRQLMKWQHLIDTAELKLIFKIATVDQKLISVGLNSGIRAFELLSPLSKLIGRGLQVRILGTWLSFKWTTGRGNTQFQVAIENLATTKQIISTLRSNGVPIITCAPQPQRNLVGSEPFTMSGITTAARLDRITSPSQLTQFSQTVPLSQIETQVEEEGPVFVHDDFSQRWEPTQVEDDIELPDLSSETNSDRHMDSVQLDPTVGGENAATVDSSPLTANEIAELIDHDQTINLNIDKFAEASTSLISTQKILWKTAGLTSGLVLSLVTKNANGQCAIILSRGCDALHSFAFNTSNLRAFGAAGLLVLCYSVRATQTKHMLQLDLPAADFNLVRDWLKHWNIRIESPMAAIPHTESTALLSSMRPASGYSAHPSEHRFWAQRFRPYSAMSKDSRLSYTSKRRSNVSRGSIHMNLSEYMSGPRESGF